MLSSRYYYYYYFLVDIIINKRLQGHLIEFFGQIVSEIRLLGYGLGTRGVGLRDVRRPTPRSVTVRLNARTLQALWVSSTE